MDTMPNLSCASLYPYSNCTDPFTYPIASATATTLCYSTRCVPYSCPPTSIEWGTRSCSSPSSHLPSDGPTSCALPHLGPLYHGPSS